jgi:hypothetical protein
MTANVCRSTPHRCDPDCGIYAERHPLRQVPVTRPAAGQTHNRPEVQHRPPEPVAHPPYARASIRTRRDRLSCRATGVPDGPVIKGDSRCTKDHEARTAPTVLLQVGADLRG